MHATTKSDLRLQQLTSIESQREGEESRTTERESDRMRIPLLGGRDTSNSSTVHLYLLSVYNRMHLTLSYINSPYTVVSSREKRRE